MAVPSWRISQPTYSPPPPRPPRPPVPPSVHSSFPRSQHFEGVLSDVSSPISKRAGKRQRQRIRQQQQQKEQHSQHPQHPQHLLNLQHQQLRPSVKREIVVVKRGQQNDNSNMTTDFENQLQERKYGQPDAFGNVESHQNFSNRILTRLQENHAFPLPPAPPRPLIPSSHFDSAPDMSPTYSPVFLPKTPPPVPPLPPLQPAALSSRPPPLHPSYSSISFSSSASSSFTPSSVSSNANNSLTSNFHISSTTSMSSNSSSMPAPPPTSTGQHANISALSNMLPPPPPPLSSLSTALLNSFPGPPSHPPPSDISLSCTSPASGWSGSSASYPPSVLNPILLVNPKLQALLDAQPICLLMPTVKLQTARGKGTAKEPSTVSSNGSMSPASSPMASPKSPTLAAALSRDDVSEKVSNHLEQFPSQSSEAVCGSSSSSCLSTSSSSRPQTSLSSPNLSTAQSSVMSNAAFQFLCDTTLRDWSHFSASPARSVTQTRAMLCGFMKVLSVGTSFASDFTDALTLLLSTEASLSKALKHHLILHWTKFSPPVQDALILAPYCPLDSIPSSDSSSDSTSSELPTLSLPSVSHRPSSKASSSSRRKTLKPTALTPVIDEGKSRSRSPNSSSYRTKPSSPGKALNTSSSSSCSSSFSSSSCSSSVSNTFAPPSKTVPRRIPNGTTLPSVTSTTTPTSTTTKLTQHHTKAATTTVPSKPTTTTTSIPADSVSSSLSSAQEALPSWFVGLIDFSVTDNISQKEHFNNVKKRLLENRMSFEQAVAFVKTCFSGGDDEDCLDVSCKVGLTDPVSMRRMSIPVRGHKCKHISCFDLRTHIVVNLQKKAKATGKAAYAPLWRCPICPAIARNVALDPYLASILGDPANSQTDRVVVYSDASYSVPNATNGTNSSIDQNPAFAKNNTVVVIDSDEEGPDLPPTASATKHKTSTGDGKLDEASEEEEGELSDTAYSSVDSEAD